MQHKLFWDSSKLILDIKKEGHKLNENAENAKKFFALQKKYFNEY